jgi:hypothetical protein
MCKMNQKTSIRAVIIFCLIAFSVNTSKGEILTLGADYVFSGTASVGTPAPWLTAVFDDQAYPGYVTVTLTATNLLPSEFVSKWLLNVDPAITPSSLGFTYLTKTGAFVTPTVTARGTDEKDPAYKADGDGYFDILFAFADSNFDEERFNGGESVTFKISGVTSASSFNVASYDGGGAGQYRMGAHIQGIPAGATTTSDWVGPAIPEPSSFVLIGIGAAGLYFYVRRQRKAP